MFHTSFDIYFVRPMGSTRKKGGRRGGKKEKTQKSFNCNGNYKVNVTRLFQTHTHTTEAENVCKKESDTQWVTWVGKVTNSLNATKCRQNNTVIITTKIVYFNSVFYMNISNDLGSLLTTHFLSLGSFTFILKVNQKQFSSKNFYFPRCVSLYHFSNNL